MGKTGFTVIKTKCKVCGDPLIPFSDVVYEHLNQHLRNKEIEKVRKYPAAVDFSDLKGNYKRQWCYNK